MEKQKTLNFFDLIGLGVGSSLSIAVYVLLEEIIKNVAGPAVIVSILLAFFTAAFAGLCFFEFGVFFLNVESLYFFCYPCHRENTAFIISWILVLQHTAGTASIIKGIIVFIDRLLDSKIENFLKQVVPIYCDYLCSYFDFLSICFVIILMIFVIFDIKNSRSINNVFTICNISVLVIIIIVGSVKADIKNWNIGEFKQHFKGLNFAPYGFLGVIKGAAIALYGFIGFEAIYMSGNRAKNPQRNLPIATFVTLLLITLLYIGPGTVLSLMTPFNQQNSFAGFPSVFEQYGWNVIKWIAIIGPFFGFQTSLFGMLYSIPRLISSMANDGMIFQCFASSNSKLKTPRAAVLASGVLTATAVGFFTFNLLVNLTVAGTLFFYTIVALDTIFLRYDYEGKVNTTSEECGEACNQTEDVSVILMLQNCFNISSKIPTMLTRKIVTMNIIFFCVSSISLGILFNFYNEKLVACAVEVIVPTVVFFLLILLALLSIICQPKLQRMTPFQIPIVPGVPCLGIFFNIFLMTSLGSSTWICFSLWTIIGVFLHFICYSYRKCFKGHESQNSLFEINKLNFLKLNESIWKINKEKKSFYDGAFNPVFLQESEYKYENNIHSYDVNLPELQPNEDIQVVNLKIVDNIKPEESDSEVHIQQCENISSNNNLEISLPKDIVQSKCVAEVHEEEFVEQFLVSEIVDTSYNFLTEISEKLEKDEDFLGVTDNNSLQVEERFDPFKEPKSNSHLENNYVADSECKKESEPPCQDSDGTALTESHLITSNKEKTDKTPPYLLKKEIMKELHEELHKFNHLKNDGLSKNLNINEEKEKVKEGEKEQTFNYNKGELININSPTDDDLSRSKEKNLKETLNDSKNDTLNNIYNNNKENNTEKKKKDTKEEMFNKISDFKEKLNHLLKNQIKINKEGNENNKNNDINNIDSEHSIKQNTDDNLKENIKTLNKSQIRQKLDILLAKGPPQRPSLKNSFKINLSEEDGINENKNSSTTPTSKEIGGHGEANPNTNWLQSRGLWFSYCLGILALHLILLCIPFLTIPVVWTVTNVFHNIIHLIFLHTLKGTPWLSQDQGACRMLTHWEQIDDGLQFTSTRKFLSIVPIVLFFLCNFYTKYDPVHFYINFISLIVVLLPKLPLFHKVRIFGINKY